MRIPSNKIKDVVSFFRQELQGMYDDREINSFINLVMETYTGLNKVQLHTNDAILLNESVLLKIKFAINDLKIYKPIQYILGKTWFYNLEYKLTSDVLIPRPETEELVKWIIDDCKTYINTFNILDIGCGSGCIPISLKKYLTNAEVFAMDISEKAVEVAEINSRYNEVTINFILLDIFDNEKWKDVPEMDVIVSNPPYVCESEKKLMQSNVLDYEPHLALFVSDENPLIFYNAIADLALLKLKNNGCLFFEINENLSFQTKALLESKGFNSCEIRKDMQAKNRMIKAVFNV
ncbi:MAG: peptide chain release factor N(5)-glutamine methyltransferase [Bacteroidales bacterium]